MTTNSLSQQAWLMTQESFSELQQHLLHQELLGAFNQNQQGLASLSDSQPPLQNKSGLVTLPIHGAMFRQVSPILAQQAQKYGLRFCDMQQLGHTLQQIAQDQSVHSVVFDIDSPGGTVNGTPELAHAVRKLCESKHVYAFSSGQCCSAAYWVASQCDAIYATPSASLGSIGVLMPLVDLSAMYEKAGVKVELFTAGRYKGIGAQGGSLNDEQREMLAQNVACLWQDFKEAVTLRRSIDEASMEGQSFSGRQACGVGLVDACVFSFDELLLKLSKRHSF